MKSQVLLQVIAQMMNQTVLCAYAGILYFTVTFTKRPGPAAWYFLGGNRASTDRIRLLCKVKQSQWSEFKLQGSFRDCSIHQFFFEPDTPSARSRPRWYLKKRYIFVLAWLGVCHATWSHRHRSPHLPNPAGCPLGPSEFLHQESRRVDIRNTTNGEIIHEIATKKSWKYEISPKYEMKASHWVMLHHAWCESKFRFLQTKNWNAARLNFEIVNFYDAKKNWKCLTSFSLIRNVLRNSSILLLNSSSILTDWHPLSFF